MPILGLRTLWIGWSLSEIRGSLLDKNITDSFLGIHSTSLSQSQPSEVLARLFLINIFCLELPFTLKIHFY